MRRMNTRHSMASLFATMGYCLLFITVNTATLRLKTPKGHTSSVCDGQPDGGFADLQAACTDFFTCRRGHLSFHQCQPGDRFDASLQACAPAGAVACDHITRHGPIHGQEHLLSFDCKNVADAFYADVNRDCRHYYKCHLGQKHTFFCTHGTRFDVTRSKCMPEDDVTCSAVTTAVDTMHRVEDSLHLECTDLADGYYVDLATDCRHYYECRNGQKQTYVCPHHTKFDESESECLPEARVTCPARKSYPPGHGRVNWLGFDCTGLADGFYADSSHDCRNYHECENGQKQTYFCPHGTQFDETEAACLPEEQVNCPAPELSGASSHKPKASSQMGQSCEGRQDGFHADRWSQCIHFFRCDGADIHHFTCPEDTIFDEDMDICRPASEYTCPLPEARHLKPNKADSIYIGRKLRQIKFKRINSVLDELKALLGVGGPYEQDDDDQH